MITLIALLLLQSVQADDYSFRMGPGIVDGKQTGTVKTFSFRQETPLVYSLQTALEGGFWNDTEASRHSSAFALGQVGVKPGSETGLYGSAFIGVAALSHTDSLLGGHVQFVENIGLGVRDEMTFTSVDYRHFSSAGLSKPNKGRDFFVFSVGIRL